jgi:hypothetical protein
VTDGAGERKGPERVLVVANETVGGRSLIEAVKAHAERGPIAARVVCPQNRPKHGLVVHDDSVRMAAANRLELTLAQLREAGIEATGEITDPDPYSAVMDVLADEPADCLIVSTHPHTRSGWLRRSLVDRLRDDTGLPVEHIVVDLEAEREHSVRTLVVANQTVGGQKLLDLLKRKASEERHSFIVIAPQSGDDPDAAPGRLASTLERLMDAKLEAVGQVMDPDPYTAIQNALQYYSVDEIVISTLPETRSGWLGSDLIERVRSSTDRPVEHLVVEPEREEATV